jgi:hypothetical protein
MSEEKVAATKAEVQRLLDAGFIWEVTHPLASKRGDGQKEQWKVENMH